MFLFTFLGPEMLVLVFGLGFFVLVVWLIIKLIKGLFGNKKSNTSSRHSGDKIAQLERLAALKQKGLLTDEEFQREKRKLL